ncbi:hypothetical protein M5D96_010706 [Drosophila gunungcola]|uniref:Uncharacterized protein n=1 Tax=Drosophila gunungcola TaxID=103775 RepID=A0A9Q0BLF8_9MUSC|nr:hypothetical protein M5D96_010706 [Drosophila gunungcola]
MFFKTTNTSPTRKMPWASQMGRSRGAYLHLHLMNDYTTKICDLGTETTLTIFLSNILLNFRLIVMASVDAFGSNKISRF